MTVSIAIALIFIWAGFVSAISFMEAWLKFRAPRVTLPIGLGIGKLVFKALNRMEWVFALGAILCLLLAAGNLPGIVWLLIPVVLFIAMQTFWALPKLEQRANAIITGEIQVPEQGRRKSGKHRIFVAVEGIKVLMLLVLGLSLMGG